MLADHGMLKRTVLERHLSQLATGFVHRLLNCHRNFTGLALAHTDAAIAIAHHGQCSEAENTATLHNLGNAIDRDHLFAHAVVALLGGLRALGLLLSHSNPRLELKAAFAGSLSQRLDAAVIEEARAVKRNRLDPGSLGALGNQLADHCSCLFVAAIGKLGTNRRLDGGGRRENAGAAAGNHLGIHVRIGTEHGEAHRLELRELGASFTRTAKTSFFSVHDEPPYFFLVSLSTTTSSE